MNIKPLKQLVPRDVYGILESYCDDGMFLKGYHRLRDKESIQRHQQRLEKAKKRRKEREIEEKKDVNENKKQKSDIGIALEVDL